LFENINPKDADFLKYVPDGFLNKEQKQAKERALEEERVKYGKKNTDVTPSEEGYTSSTASGPPSPQGEGADIEISEADRKKQAERREKVKSLCDLFGLSLEWDESIKRGKYNPNTRTVFINPNLTLTEMYIEVLKHEFTHDLENRRLYKGFKEFLFGKSKNFRDYCETVLKNDYGEELKGDKAIKRLTQLKYRDYMNSDELNEKEKTDFDNEAAEREIVADFVAERLLGGKGTDGNFEQEAYETLKELSEYHRSGFQRFVDWIRELINKIKDQPTFKDMADELEYLNKQIAKVYDSKISTNKTTHVGDKHYIAYDSKGNKYWKIETEKDIFKGLKTTEELKKAAYKYIIGMRDNNVVVDAIDGKKMSFLRVSAEEFTKSNESQELKQTNPMLFAQKMRLIPSIDDLAANANINWTSPDLKNHKLFKEKGFENFRGRVGIDNVIFNFVIRAGKTKFGDIFYDINLEVDHHLPHTKDGASGINRSTSKDSVRNNSEKVKENSDSTGSHSIAVPFSEEFKAEKRKKYAEGLVKKYGGDINGAELENYLKEISIAAEENSYSEAFKIAREMAQYISINGAKSIGKTVPKNKIKEISNNFFTQNRVIKNRTQLEDKLSKALDLIMQSKTFYRYHEYNCGYYKTYNKSYATTEC